MNQGSGKEMTADNSSVSDQHPDSAAGDCYYAGDDGGDDEDHDDEIPVWMRDPPAEEQTNENDIDLSPSTQTEVLDPKEQRECSKCKAVFYNPWDFDLHFLECSKVRKPRQHSSTLLACELCGNVVKRRDILYHYFKVHDLHYEEAVKKIPRYNVSLSKVKSYKGRNSKKVRSAGSHMLHCDLCDTVLSKRSILMHLFRLHGISYQEAVQKISGFKDQANKERQGSPKQVRYLLRNKTAKNSSPAKENIEAETKTEKRRTRQRKTKVNSRKRKLQPSQITKAGEPMIKVAYVKLEEVDCNEQLEYHEEHREQRTECNERRMNKSPEKAPQGSPIADESQDEVVTEITRESRGKDIGVVPEEDGHNEPNQELEQSVDSDHDKRSGKSIPIPLAEDACTNIIDQSEVWQDTSDTIVESEERDEMIDPDQMRRDNDSLEEHVREDSDVSIQEEGNKVSENIASPQNTISIHVDKEETVIENKEEPTGAIEGEGPFPCEICGQCFNSQGLVQDHLVTVHFQCTTCCKTLKNKLSLKVHIRRHKNQATGVIYTCSVCQKSFFDKHVHESHVKIHSAEKVECQYCHKKFSNANNLHKHINRKHTQKVKYPCNHCGQCFFTNYKLQCHVTRKHAREKEWNCDECGKTFYREADVVQHKKCVHMASGQHLCELCGASYKSRGNLTQHHQTAHTDTCKFTCDICGKNFKRSSHLNAHRTVHTDSRPFECKICGKGFRIKAKLQVHMNWHNNIRPFACTLCSKTFLTKGNLDKHQTVHTKIYKHSCEHCGRGFPDFSQLRHHLSKAHDIIIASKITKGKREISVQSKADSQITALLEHQTQSRLPAENEPQSSATAPDDQCLRTARSVSKAGVVTDCDTLVHSSPVIAVTSGARGGDDNLLATEALVAMMHSYGIQ